MAHITVQLRTPARRAAVIVLIASALVASAAIQPAVAARADVQAEAWAAAPSMQVGRGDHTATLLPDGDVLAVGGSPWPDAAAAATAERFDAQTLTWSLVDAPEQPRDGTHTATALRDGRVLIAGGTGGVGWFGSAEIFDPTTGVWTATYPMVKQRSSHAAALLTDGRVLVLFGDGEASSGVAPPSGETFDPSTHEWKRIAEPPADLRPATATVLRTGMVLVTGSDRDAVGRTLLYDPLLDRWTERTPMPLPRDRHSATLLHDGTVLVAGGYAQHDFLPSAEVYDPLLDQWKSVEARSHGVLGANATLLPDGRVLFSGGAGAERLDGHTEIFDPKTQSFSVAASHTPRERPAATLLGDGRVMLSGGLYTETQSVQIFTTVDQRPALCRDLPVCP